MPGVSIIIVDDSPVARELLASTFNADPRLQVIATAESGEKAVELVARLRPDIVSMDLRLPGISGIETTRRIMANCPTPIIVVAADLQDDTVNRSMEALRAGALSVVEKPRVQSASAYRSMARRLCDQFVNLSGIHVVRQRFSRKSETVHFAPPPPTAAPSAPHQIDIIGIVASTGGPPAIAKTLQNLPAHFDTPILLVQHMSAGFVAGFAGWLDSVCGFDVVLGAHGDAPQRRTVHVAPGGTHMTYRNDRLRLHPDETGRGHIPSGDVLFRSLAADAGPHAVGIILTGMGADGAEGLFEMRQSGGRTLAQDEESCAVYGMPAAAMAIGAVDEQVPLAHLPGRLAALVAARRMERAS